MRVLLIHNHYAQRGGEDAVFAQERKLLQDHGNEVAEYTKDNRHLTASNSLRLAVDAIWSREADRDVAELIERFRPEVLHAHNTLPQISPSIYHTASRLRVPVVQTLHNYRLVCANGLLLRDGRVCEACVGRAIGLPALLHGCYRGSRAATLSVVATLGVHKAIGTWSRKVTRYIALCQFAKAKILATGIPPERVVIKPNFVIDRHGSDAAGGQRSGALFVGRLSIEKGVDTLVQAWANVPAALEIYGTGDLEPGLRRDAVSGVKFNGFAESDTIAAAMRRASFLVMPSRYYEGFPVVLAEAFSAGLPVIASRLGALEELVQDGVTGLHFTSGDAHELAAKVQWALANPQRMTAMGRAARSVYEAEYAPLSNYRRLMAIYRDAQQAV